MNNHYFSILKVFKNKTFRISMVVFMTSIFLFSFSFVNIHADTTPQKLPTVTSQLLHRSVFKENEQSSTHIYPHFTDGSTNIIFFTDNAPQYFAEAILNGSHLLSDYFEPPLTVGTYTAVEYKNEAGRFGCSGLSLHQCIADPHFVSQFSFEVVDDNTVISASSTNPSLSDTLVTDFSSGVSQFVYVGKMQTAQSICHIETLVTTSGSDITWAEVGIFKGVLNSDGPVTLKRVGVTNVAKTFNSSGPKNTDVSIQDVTPDDDLWVVLGSQATTPFQIRGMKNSLAPGLLQTAQVRPYIAGDSLATTLAPQTLTPGWVQVSCE